MALGTIYLCILLQRFLTVFHYIFRVSLYAKQINVTIRELPSFKEESRYHITPQNLRFHINTVILSLTLPSPPHSFMPLLLLVPPNETPFHRQAVRTANIRYNKYNRTAWTVYRVLFGLPYQGCFYFMHS